MDALYSTTILLARRLLAVRLFSQNPSSFYLIQRDCKLRGIGTRREKTDFVELTPSFFAARGFAARVLRFRV